jgi:hypothetical protein
MTSQKRIHFLQFVIVIDGWNTVNLFLHILKLFTFSDFVSSFGNIQANLILRSFLTKFRPRKAGYYYFIRLLKQSHSSLSS